MRPVERIVSSFVYFVVSLPAILAELLVSESIVRSRWVLCNMSGQQFHSVVVEPTQSQKLDIDPWSMSSSKKPSSNVSPDVFTAALLKGNTEPGLEFTSPVDRVADSGDIRRMASKKTPRNTPAESYAAWSSPSSSMQNSSLFMLIWRDKASSDLELSRCTCIAGISSGGLGDVHGQ